MRDRVCWAPASRPTAVAVLGDKGYAGDDQRDTEELQRRGYLGQNHDADDGGRGGEQGTMKGVGGAAEPGYGELVADVGNHRGGDTDAATCGQA